MQQQFCLAAASLAAQAVSPGGLIMVFGSEGLHTPVVTRLWGGVCLANSMASHLWPLIHSSYEKTMPSLAGRLGRIYGTPGNHQLCMAEQQQNHRPRGFVILLFCENKDLGWCIGPVFIVEATALPCHHPRTTSRGRGRSAGSACGHVRTPRR